MDSIYPIQLLLTCLIFFLLLYFIALLGQILEINTLNRLQLHKQDEMMCKSNNGNNTIPPAKRWTNYRSSERVQNHVYPICCCLVCSFIRSVGWSTAGLSFFVVQDMNNFIRIYLFSWWLRICCAGMMWREKGLPLYWISVTKMNNMFIVGISQFT